MDRFAAMQAFVKVAELGSFVRAADALGISRTMATVHVARLEEHLRTRLINRTTRRLSLTEAGGACYERCAALLSEIQSLEDSLQATADTPAGVVKLSAPVSFGVLHLGSALAEYVERYPAVGLDVHLNDRAVDLVEEGYDLAIRIARLLDSSLVARRIATTRMCVCASPQYLKRHGAPKNPAELAGRDCLSYTYASSGDTWLLEGPEGMTEARVRTRYRANNGDLLRALALHGRGIALLPAFIVADDLKARRLTALLPKYSAGQLGIFAVFPSRKYLSAKVRALVDFLAGRFARQRW